MEMGEKQTCSSKVGLSQMGSQPASSPPRTLTTASFKGELSCQVTFITEQNLNALSLWSIKKQQKSKGQILCQHHLVYTGKKQIPLGWCVHHWRLPMLAVDSVLCFGMKLNSPVFEGGHTNALSITNQVSLLENPVSQVPCSRG